MTSLALHGFTWPQTAADTALRVLRWAAESHGPPPSGSPRQPSGVASSAAVTAALRELTRITAAKLGAGQPILDDPTPITLGGAFIAAAVGCRHQPELAGRLAALIRPPALGRGDETGWADAIARHAVAGPALAGAGQLAQDWLAASPLTNVLAYPGDNSADRAVDTALGLLARPHGQRVLVSALAPFDPDPRVLEWRARLLNRIAGSHTLVVTEVYAAARFRYGAVWDRELRAADQHLSALPPAGEAGQRAVATLRYWSALTARPVARAMPGTLWREEAAAALSLLRRFPVTDGRAA